MTHPERLVRAPGTFSRLLRTVPKALAISIALVGLLTIGVITVSELTYSRTISGLDRLRGERERIDLVDDLLEVVLNAETGQRGYLLTGRAEYLAPLERARRQLPVIRAALDAGLREQPDRRAAAMQLLALCQAALDRLDESVRRGDAGDPAAVDQKIPGDADRRQMDGIRAGIEQLSASMSDEFRSNRQRSRDDMLTARLGLLFVACLNLVLLVAVVRLLVRDLAQKDQIARLIDSDNIRLAGEVAERTAELHELTTHLQQSTERDKAALARDLHDELGGILTSVKMDVDWLRSRTPSSPEIDARLNAATQMLSDAVALKRRVVEDLRPSLLDHLGLVPALEWHVAEHCSKAGLQCRLALAEATGPVVPDTAIAIYRIVQEALTNVIRHARAGTFALELICDQQAFRLVISDDGIGLPSTFNPSSLSHGLSGMRQRARALGGNVAWRSSPGEGTTIDVLIPRSG